MNDGSWPFSTNIFNTSSIGIIFIPASYAAFLRVFSSGHKCSYETPQASAMACCIGLDTPTSCTTRDIMAVETPSFILRSRSLIPLLAAINVLMYKGLFCFFSFFRLDSLIMYLLYSQIGIYCQDNNSYNGNIYYNAYK